ncbi:zinc finger protein 513a isoform X1 [Tachysurus vachellii]|uniref:zinc finger protein 513a isoform X1 n=1 Tax=Tachysurus vachellii TaxID=175792 RepID=UPI00296B1BA3|nr:zinc finger protein 513a isoform X1 [Tachysurus vachellii]XP_060722566.1 zinc finger protein 513a isoform X1 [Tachysurus vachellii]
MPRRKQQNPQPVKLDSDDGININPATTLTFESDFLLGQDLDFSDADNSKILGLDKFSANSFQLGDEESSSFSHLSMESDTHDLRTAENEREGARPEPAFPHYISCRGCNQLLDEDEHSCLRCSKCDGTSIGDRSVHVGAPSLHKGPDGEGAGTENGQQKLNSCPLCGFSSRYTNHVKRHMKTHNGEKPYRCSLCTYASAQLVNLQRHLRIHTGEKPYKCEHCTFACSSLGNLKRHQRMHTVASPAHNTQQRMHTAINPGQNTHQSMHMVTSPAQNSQRMMSGHSLRGPVGCQSIKEDAPRASREVLQSSEMKGNLSIGSDSGYLKAFARLKSEQQPCTRAQPGVLPPLLFPFTCRLCGLVLDGEDGSSAQICAKCTLEMLTKDAAGSASERGHRGDRVYTCAACPFLTHYPNHLARHMKTHSGEKPYKCPQCPYASAHFDNLKRHHRVHTGEKPYKCHLCDYACGNLANLKRHQRVHSGAKPFQCSVCSYSCNQSMNLKRHMLRHTGEKPHKCHMCTYTTGHWDNYKRHQKKHGIGTDDWDKVPLPANEEEAEIDEEEEEEEEA